MNRERAKELLPIIEAYANGDTIQSRVIGCDQWIDNPDTNWPDDFEYRIKPEPREFYLYLPDNWRDGVDVYTTAACLPNTPSNAIKVREVLE